MAEQNPTVIIAHLDDEKLRKSIDSLVGYVDEKFKAMTTSTTNAVNTMQQSLNKLGELKITSTGSGGESRSTAIKKEKREVEDLKVSYDQMAQALQKATRYPSEMRMQDQSKSARDSYLAFMQGYKAQGEAIARQIQEAEAALNRAVQNRATDLNAKLDEAKRKLNELYTTLYQEQEKARSAGTLDMPFNAGIERTQQSIEYAKKHIEELNAAIAKVSPNMFTEQVQQIEQLRARRERVLDTMKEEVTTQQQSVQVETQQLNIDTKRTEELQKQIGLIQSRGDAKKTFENAAAMPVDTYEQAQEKLRVLESLKEKVANTPLFSKNQTQALGNEIEKVRVKMSFLYRTTEEGVAEEKARVAAQNKLMQDRLVQIEKEKAALKERGLAAQQSANAIREAMRDQLQDNMATGTQQAIRGLKDLQQHIRDMQRAFGAMNQEEQESPIGRALKNDIRLAREAMVAVSKYNLSAVTGRQTPIEGLERFDSYKLLSQRVSRLTKEYQDLTAAERDAEKGKGMAEKIQLFSRALQEIQRQMSRPVSLKSAFGLEENTLERIAYKMQQLNAYKMGLDITDPKQVAEMKQVEQEYDRLKKKSDELMGKNQQLMNSNNALARSWNYMKNRLAFYFTVGASTAFVKNLIEVRSQYEMSERALGILIDSAERGTQIFNELSQMALVSPYTLIELSTASKQLSAYDVAAKDLVDTTRRLADISAAVGLPVERLTTALGQIKAFEHLTSMTARRFSSAGIPLIKALADHYTELEGKMVSVADVYDRMKKKAISYNDVMAVITEMTDEGGKFFDFQAKMADTLKVQLANLTLAWNNMLNDIGESQQGILTGGIGALKELLLQWKNIEKVLTDIAVIIGIVKASQLLLNAAFGKGTLAAVKQNVALTSNSVEAYKNILAKRKLTVEQAKWIIATNKGSLALRNAIVEMGILTAAEANAAAGTTKLGLVWRTFTMILSSSKVALESFMASLSAVAPQLAIFAAISATVDLIQTVMQRNEAVERFNETLVRNAKQHADAIKNVLADYKDGFDATSLSLGEQTKHWDRLREEIELNSAAANTFIQALLQEDNMGERVNKATKLLEKLEQAHTLMSLWGTDALNVSEDFKILGMGADGLANDAKDFVKAMNAANGEVENLAELSQSTEGTWRQVLAVMNDIKTISTWDGWNPTKFLNPLQYADWFGGFGSDDDKEKNKLVDAYKELQSEIRPLAESLANQIINSGVEDIDQVKEMISQSINDLAEEQNLSDQAVLSTRLLLEEEFRNSSIKILRDSVADRQASWDMWMKFLMSRHKTVFGKMGEEEINAEEWAQSKRKELYENTFEEFKKFNILAAKDIEDKVNDLNSLQVHIKVFYDEQNQPSWLEKDFKNRLPQSTLDVSQYTSVSELISGEQKAYKEATEELENLNKAGIQQGDHYWDVKKRADQAKEALVAYNAELEKEPKGKQGGTKKDVFGDALSKEIQYISDIQKRFKEYQKMGVDAQQALTLATDEYGKSIIRNNAILQKYGVKTLSSEQLATMPLQEIRDFYQEQLNGATSSTKGVEALEKAIANLNVEITKIDYKRITDGLNNELSKIKDEYELAVELDANPELGGIFMDIFDIDPNNLPNTIDAYATKVMEALNRSFEKQGKGFRLDTLSLTDDDLRAYKAESEKQMGAISEEDYKNIEKYTKEIRNLRKKDREDTLKQTQDLQYKLGDVNEKIAIESKKLADLQVKYQKETNDEKKRLLDLQIKDQENTIAKLGEEVLQMLPTYKNLFSSIAEHSAVVTQRIAKQWKGALENAVKNPDGTYTITDPKSGEKATLSEKEYGRQLDKVNGKLRETQSSFAKIREAFTKGEDGEIDFAKGLEYIAEEAKKAADGLHTVADIVTTLGGSDEAVETLNDIATSMEGAATAAQGFAQIQSGDYIGGAVNVLKGTWQAVSTWFDNGDKKISREIAASEYQVKKLELAYIDLEHAINESYGMATIGAKRAALANKELQLAELKRQLTLEQSRKKKNQDQNRILDLKKQIKELEYDIKETSDSIVNDLLGISSVGDAMDSFMDGFIDALRNGEDAMAVFDESVDDMVANMVKKMFTTKILQPWFEDVWDKIQQGIEQRAANEFERAKMTDEQIMQQIMHDRGYRKYLFRWIGGKGGYATQDDIDKYREDLQKDLIRATEPTTNDIKKYAELLRTGQPIMEDSMEEIRAFLEELNLINKSKDDNLSSLQQGIQGITEDTAGALEAITNGISQQCYLQSDLLTQIRDAVVAIDSDAQLGVQAQMLLQLQQSYAIQVAIQGILAGWSNPSGLAVRVEMV